MKNIVKAPRKMFDIPTFKARVQLLISGEGTPESERKMACLILENVLRSSGNYNGYIINGSEYNRRYL